MMCRNCGKEINQDGNFCQYCGHSIDPFMHQENDSSMVLQDVKASKRRKTTVLVIIILAAVVALICISQVTPYKNYCELKQFYDAENFFDAYINCSKNNYGFFSKLSEKIIDGCKEELYNYAVLNYRNNKYSDGNVYAIFNALSKDGYRDSDQYFTAVRWFEECSDNTNAASFVQEMKSLLGFGRVNNDLLNSMLGYAFLSGEWRTADGDSHITMTQNGGSWNVIYNLPHYVIENSYFVIIDGAYYSYPNTLNVDTHGSVDDAVETIINNGGEKFFSFNIIDSDTIAVQVFKTSETLILYRK